MTDTHPSSQSATTPTTPSSGVMSGGTAPTHRVKKLLESYIGSASRSLTGPAHTDLEEPPYKRMAYKLPPDVELSKTSAMEDAHCEKDLKRKVSPGPGQVDLADRISNGLVTLSRIDEHGGNNHHNHLEKSSMGYSGSRHSLPSVEPQRPRMLMGQHSLPGSNRFNPGSELYSPGSNRHLTGEAIRRLGQGGKDQLKNNQMPYKGPMENRLISQDKPRSLGPHNVPSASLHQTFKRPNNGSSSGDLVPPSVSAPVLSTRDRGQSELTDTTLNGEKISCFSVGGEFRLCLPQILNTVLDSISLQSIHQACDELQIYCSTCSPDQLETLKRLKILPVTAYQCGLITKSDAERLCATLLERNPPRASLTGFNAKASPFSFKVEHECFGKCVGILLPEACTNVSARCIECLECEGLFSPPKFVCHSHHSAENRTCHWGFDSANWRSYLHLYEGYTEAEKERLQRRFSDFKSKYANFNANLHNIPMTLKRKLSDEHIPTGRIAHQSAALQAASQMAAATAGVPTKKARHSMDSSDLPQGPSNTPFPVGGLPPGADPVAYYYSMVASKGQIHPAAAAWAANMAALKDGKTPPFPNFPHGGLPVGASSGSPGFGPHSRASHNPMIRRSSSSPTPPMTGRSSSLKSSPASSQVESPGEQRTPSSLGHNMPSTRQSPLVVATPSGSAHLFGRDNHSSGGHHTPARAKSSLAEDIQTIRDALDGASSQARERTLKILERLTARLALAESERDRAISDLAGFQKKFRVLEEELMKKREELRELLRQEGLSHRSAVTLELLTESAEMRGNVSGSRGIGGVDPGGKKAFSALPKVEMKSPARIIEEKERYSNCVSRGSTKSSVGGPPGTPLGSESGAPAPSNTPSSIVRAPSPSGEDSRTSKGEKESKEPGVTTTATQNQRHLSGTPVSTKSKQDSEDLRDRMMTMEAELRALRDELSSRSIPKKTTSTNGDPGVKSKVENGTPGPEMTNSNHEDTDGASSGASDQDDP
eukprot:maker-scaffold125_size330479-snap-gene-2.18 protein:Tk06894 transcript:maker-scaffold125_size330479-snap-gene-2.18-mRNA-1 annotation:"ski oncogene"